MQIFIRYLERQSPTPQLASDSHGWLELPDGRRWSPCVSEFSFNKLQQAKRRRWWFRLMGLRG
ncbi:hypothetical protein DYG62_20980 [Yersinia enterocolitica]|nr:hypothetical protein [Yersinia enterocolitica]